ncbi:MAG: hypothetical protein C5B50_22145 [Verrucomicrobia bacterium]|nr:MAG: hypothetical protein C5B50_22145 [Verrucomicrobiota bacterium]
MQFQVLVDGDPRPVEVAFGSARELALVDRWRAPSAIRSVRGVRDSIEFARLASKRWRYYRKSISTATDLDLFRSIVTRDARAEISLLLVARANWFSRSPILGLAQCRRTYCNHLILEFLSVHPAIVGGAIPRVRGVGAGLIYSLAEVAGLVGVPLIWGEATQHSAPFYSKTCRLTQLADHFFIRAKSLAHCRKQFRTRAHGVA